MWFFFPFKWNKNFNNFHIFIVSSVVLFTNSLPSDLVEWIYVPQRSNFSSSCAVTYWILFSTSFALFHFNILNTGICLLKHKFYFYVKLKSTTIFLLFFSTIIELFTRNIFSIHKSHAWEIKKNFFVPNIKFHCPSFYWFTFLVLKHESFALEALSRKINAFMYSCCVGLIVGFIIYLHDSFDGSLTIEGWFHMWNC